MPALREHFRRPWVVCWSAKLMSPPRPRAYQRHTFPCKPFVKSVTREGRCLFVMPAVLRCELSNLCRTGERLMTS